MSLASTKSCSISTTPDTVRVSAIYVLSKPTLLAIIIMPRIPDSWLDVMDSFVAEVRREAT